MRTTFWAIALAGTIGCGSQGPSGDPGQTGEKGEKGEPGETTANLAAIQPTTAFLGRQVTVQIGGNNTHFAQGMTKVDFGDANIKVDKVTVGSPTLLIAQITVGPEDPTKAATYAQAKLHDVTITTQGDKAETVTLKQQFNVVAPLRFITLTPDNMAGGKLVQGGIGSFVVTNLDYIQNPFGSIQSPLFGLSFLEDGAASPLSGNTSLVQARAFINVKAAAAPIFFALSPSPLGAQTLYPLPAGVDMVSPKIDPRTPVDLTLGTAKDGKFMGLSETALYKLTPSGMVMGDRMYSFTFKQAMTAKIRPALALLPASGKWTDQLATGGGRQLADPVLGTPYFAVVVGDAKEMYPIVFDSQLGGGDGYEYSVTAKEKGANVIAMYVAGIKADMPNKQIDLSKGANFYKPTALATHTEKNYFEFIAPKDDKIYVVTSANDPTKDDMDNTVDVLEGTCKAGTSVTGGPVDDDYYDSVSFDAKMGKTYCVVIGDSDFPFSPQMGGPYNLLITSN